MPSILIIGAGKIGSAIATVLKTNEDTIIALWDKDPSKISESRPLPELISQADVLFLCIPSWTHRAVIEEVKIHIKKNAVVISVAKGLEEKTFKTIDEIIGEYLSPRQVGLLYGPMLADELLAGSYGAGVIASREKSVYLSVAPLFGNSKLLTEYSSDIHGVALCGVLKNIYAILLGIADGLDLGYNARGILVTRTLSEMASILKQLGGQPETAQSFAGVGDFLATSLSPNSNNYSFGKDFAISGECKKTTEGCVSLAPLLSLLPDPGLFPLLECLQEILINKQPIHEMINRFFKE